MEDEDIDDVVEPMFVAFIQGGRTGEGAAGQTGTPASGIATAPRESTGGGSERERLGMMGRGIMG